MQVVDDFLSPPHELAVRAGRDAARLARVHRGKVEPKGDIVFASGKGAARLMRKFLK